MNRRELTIKLKSRVAESKRWSQRTTYKIVKCCQNDRKKLTEKKTKGNKKKERRNK